MKRFTLDEKPTLLVEMRKRLTVMIAYSKQPFEVETQEGRFVISPETVDDWDGEVGYAVAYPTDGSKPYAIAPRYLLDNYELTGSSQSAG